MDESRTYEIFLSFLRYEARVINGENGRKEDSGREENAMVREQTAE